MFAITICVIKKKSFCLYIHNSESVHILIKNIVIYETKNNKQHISSPLCLLHAFSTLLKMSLFFIKVKDYVSLIILFLNCLFFYKKYVLFVKNSHNCNNIRYK